MSATAGTEVKVAKGGKGKLILVAAVLLVVAIGAGGWFSGLIPKLLHREPAHARPARAGRSRGHHRAADRGLARRRARRCGKVTGCRVADEGRVLAGSAGLAARH